MKRYVDVAKAGRVVAEAPEGEGAEKLRRWLEKQPTAPKLLSRKRVAEFLGIHSPYISRLEDQGRMPESIPVEGGAPVWEENDELVKLRDELTAEREKRLKKREEVSP
jgi:predicted DNA-binding transcriptional regulator AlpA